MPFTTELKYIEAAEAKLCTRLPESFRSYLLKSNGGEIELLESVWELNPVMDTSDKERVRRTSVDIVCETASAREWPGFPQEAVAIASDGCGNYLILLPCEQDPSVLSCTILAWWHESGELEVAAEDFSFTRIS